MFSLLLDIKSENTECMFKLLFLIMISPQAFICFALYCNKYCEIKYQHYHIMRFWDCHSPTILQLIWYCGFTKVLSYCEILISLHPYTIPYTICTLFTLIWPDLFLHLCALLSLLGGYMGCCLAFVLFWQEQHLSTHSNTAATPNTQSCHGLISL